MANGTLTSTLTTRGTGKENLSVPLILFEKLEKSLNSRFDKVDARFDKIDTRFEKFEKSVDAKFDKLNDKMDSHFKWMIGLLIGAIMIPIALQYFAK
jgi:hypothetical protein